MPVDLIAYLEATAYIHTSGGTDSELLGRRNQEGQAKCY